MWAAKDYLKPFSDFRTHRFAAQLFAGVWFRAYESAR